MDTLFENAMVVTCDEERRILHDTSVAVSGGKVAAIGARDALRQAYPQAERIDMTRKALLPGFINSHTHTVLTVLRGTVEDMEGDAVYGFMTPISFAMTPGERAAMARLGCLEAIKSGATTAVDPFRHVVSYADAMVESGLRLYLSENCADALTLKIRHREYVYDKAWGQQFLDRTVEMIERYHGAENGRVNCQIAAHATENCSPWMYDQLNQLARKHGLRRTVHLAQSMNEVNQVKALCGGSPADYLLQNDWLGEDVVGAHWTFCTERDIELLAEHGVHMAHCPANSSRRGPHKVLANKIIDCGVNIALGTDNMTEDMFHAMKIGSIVHRGAYGGSVSPGPQALLDGVTRNGAKALGETARLGSIETGKLADLITLDLDHATLRPIINLVANIVHYGQPEAVRDVMVEGRFVMRDRTVLTYDERAVIDDAQAATESAWKRLFEQAPDLPKPDGAWWL
ncbi:amidohydrolase family protein [Oceanibaculum pacificum]|uniref:Uncharacterized protein n=1 Tax=Oceanibaculum pacificum TaxID=580166 RepID=A0A154VS43_9PROT|nr:amidohydrolase family protein [Oceanibaculum pacificum]KZD04124.1 hypothetical protein AUP43_03195 [Oceanibaculum pacificum]